MKNKPDENLLFSINIIFHHIATVFLAIRQVFENSIRLLEIILKLRYSSFHDIDDTVVSLSNKLQDELSLLISQEEVTSKTDLLNSSEGNNKNYTKYADMLKHAREIDTHDIATPLRLHIAIGILDYKIKFPNSRMPSDIYTTAYDLAIAALLKNILRAKESLFIADKEIQDFRERISKKNLNNDRRNQNE